MSYFVLPAVIALVAKVCILFLARKTRPNSKLFTPLLIIFALHNLCEVLLFWEFIQGIKGEMVLRAYYMLTIVGWAAIVLYSMEVSENLSRLGLKLIVAVAGSFAALALLTNFVVSGSTFIGYSITAIKGSFYTVWQVYSLLAGVVTAYYLHAGYRSANNHQKEIQCIFTALALAPIVLASLIILGMMSFQYQVNAVMVIPIATTLFVAIMLASEYQHKLTDIRRFIPWSNERKTSQQIMEIFSNYSRDDINYRDAVSEIERLLVLQKYDKNAGNASETAGRMGMPRSSLYSIFNRLDIESRGDQKS